jgi:hypothetical protein
MSKRMRYGILSSIVCMLVFVSIAAPRDVKIMGRTKVGNGPELQPGTYQVEVVKNQDSAEVRFFQEGDLVVTAPAKLIDEAMKCSRTEIHSTEVDGGTVITKIWLQGSKESLRFEQDTPEKE